VIKPRLAHYTNEIRELKDNKKTFEGKNNFFCDYYSSTSIFS